MIIRPLVDELFHADRQTNRQTDGHGEANSCLRARAHITIVIIAFRNFANAPKNNNF
jgi:hypothetical protein